MRREKLLKDGIVNWRVSRLNDLENSQFIHLEKNEKACSGKDAKGVAERPFDKKKSKPS